MTPTLETGAALGAAAFVISAASLIAQHAPALTDIAEGDEDDRVAVQLHDAEIVGGTVLVAAGAAAAVLTRSWLPIVLAVGAIGVTAGIYELYLRHVHR